MDRSIDNYRKKIDRRVGLNKEKEIFERREKEYRERKRIDYK